MKVVKIERKGGFMLKKDWLFNNLNIFIYFIGLSLIDICLKLFLFQEWFFGRSFIYNLAFSFIFSAISYLFKSVYTKRIYYFISCLLFSLFAFSQHLFYRFFRDFYSFNQLSNIREFLWVKGETAKAFDIVSLIYFVLGFIMFILLYQVSKTQQANFKKAIIYCVCFCVIYSGVRLTYRNHMSDATQVYLTDNYLHKTLFDKQKALKRYGLNFYSFRDIKRIGENFFNRHNIQEINEIVQYFSQRDHQTSTNEFSAKFKNKNVVLILAESLNTWGINERITPNLYKMVKNGYYFENYYAPFFDSHTIDAEFAINTGLFPSIAFGNTAYEFSHNSYPNSLANLLRKQGYQAYSYHNSIGSFYNRFQYHQALGYEKFYDSSALDIKVPNNFGYDWPSDEELFEKVAKSIDSYDKQKPFLSYIITAANHTPYDDNRTLLKKHLDEVKKVIKADSQIQYYLAASKDLDLGIGKLIQSLEKNNRLKDTIFVLFGDHYSYGMHHDIIWSYDTASKGDFYKLHNIPLIIYDPSSKGQKISKVLSQFDVYPSLVNLLGLESDSRFYVGYDVFSDKDLTVYFGKNNVWMDQNILWDRNFVAKTFKELDNPIDYANKKTAFITKEMEMFQKVLKNNFFNTKQYQMMNK